MSGAGDKNSSKRFQIEEGVVKKGGVNSLPSSKRPGPPAAQGNGGSSSKGSSGESSGPTQGKSQ